jgi:mycothiol synthase
MLDSLPRGYVARPVRKDDAESLVRMFNLCSREWVGADLHAIQSQISDWATPGFSMQTDTIVVTAPDGNPVGYAEVSDFMKPHVRIGCWGRVHPAYRGRGIGAWLVRWEEERARLAVPRAPGRARVALRQGVPERDAEGHRLLIECGFEPVRHFWRMQIELDHSVPEPLWPEGVEVRTFDPGTDLKRAVSTAREAFRDHWGNVPRPLEQDVELWRHWIAEDGSDQTLWFLAMAGDEIVGLGLCSGTSPEDPDLGSVDSLAVVREWRRRGIGMALLQHAFRELQRRGKRRVDLGVDGGSLTGANRLYERAGMEPKRRTDLFVKELRAGRELTRQSLDGSSGEDATGGRPA